jgi:hypothetical protein
LTTGTLGNYHTYSDVVGELFGIAKTADFLTLSLMQECGLHEFANSIYSEETPSCAGVRRPLPAWSSHNISAHVLHNMNTIMCNPHEHEIARYPLTKGFSPFHATFS